MKKLTLVEVIITIILASIAIAPIMITINTSLMQTDLSKKKVAALQLANNLVEEIKSKNFSDPMPPPAWGREPDELANDYFDRRKYDDIDDYDGWNSEFSFAPRKIDGTEEDVGIYHMFRRRVIIEEGRPQDWVIKRGDYWTGIMGQPSVPKTAGNSTISSSRSSKYILIVNNSAVDIYSGTNETFITSIDMNQYKIDSPDRMFFNKKGDRLFVTNRSSLNKNSKIAVFDFFNNNCKLIKYLGTIENATSYEKISDAPASVLYTDGANNPSVVFNDQTEKFVMLFSGKKGASEKIVYADSDTETDFSNYEDVLVPGMFSPYDNTRIFCPSLIRLGGMYHLWYIGQGSSGKYSVIHCISADARRWILFERCFSGDDLPITAVATPANCDISSISVKNQDTGFQIWFTVKDRISYESSVITAFSSDGVLFTDFQKVMYNNNTEGAYDWYPMHSVNFGELGGVSVLQSNQFNEIIFYVQNFSDESKNTFFSCQATDGVHFSFPRKLFDGIAVADDGIISSCGSYNVVNNRRKVLYFSSKTQATAVSSLYTAHPETDHENLFSSPAFEYPFRNISDMATEDRDRYLLVSSDSSRNITVVDTFSMEKKGKAGVPYPYSPTKILSGTSEIFIICGGSQRIFTFDKENFQISGQFDVGAAITDADISYDKSRLYVLTGNQIEVYSASDYSLIDTSQPIDPGGTVSEYIKVVPGDAWLMVVNRLGSYLKIYNTNDLSVVKINGMDYILTEFTSEEGETPVLKTPKKFHMTPTGVKIMIATDEGEVLFLYKTVYINTIRVQIMDVEQEMDTVEVTTEVANWMKQDSLLYPPVPVITLSGSMQVLTDDAVYVADDNITFSGLVTIAPGTVVKCRENVTLGFASGIQILGFTKDDIERELFWNPYVYFTSYDDNVVGFTLENSDGEIEDSDGWNSLNFSGISGQHIHNIVVKATKNTLSSAGGIKLGGNSIVENTVFESNTGQCVELKPGDCVMNSSFVQSFSTPEVALFAEARVGISEYEVRNNFFSGLKNAVHIGRTSNNTDFSLGSITGNVFEKCETAIKAGNYTGEMRGNICEESRTFCMMDNLPGIASPDFTENTVHDVQTAFLLSCSAVQMRYNSTMSTGTVLHVITGGTPTDFTIYYNSFSQNSGLFCDSDAVVNLRHNYWGTNVAVDSSKFVNAVYTPYAFKNIQGSEIWQPGNGNPSAVLESIVIKDGTSLRIVPGTILKFIRRVPCGIFSEGFLQIEGTPGNEIVITTINNDIDLDKNGLSGDTEIFPESTGVVNPGDWLGIYNY